MWGLQRAVIPYEVKEGGAVIAEKARQDDNKGCCLHLRKLDR